MTIATQRQSVTTFEPKQSKQRACNAKAQKGMDWELELELEKQKEMRRETASVGLQKGADGLSFTMMCYPYGHAQVPQGQGQPHGCLFYEKR